MMDYRGEDLFDEKNLWAIYKTCWRRLSGSKFNRVVTTIAFAALVLQARFAKIVVSTYVSDMRNLADLGLGYGTTILGFLIAGFTIFATLTKPSLLVQMYQTVDSRSGLNYVKVNFFAFIEVFIIYVTFIACCLVIKLFVVSGGAVSQLISYINLDPTFPYSVKKAVLVKGLFVFFGTFAFYALLALKSFVYNTHHAVMTLIVWGLNEEKEDEGISKGEKVGTVPAGEG